MFAFLPLRSYGFRFILQGDFDLPSSREDVNSDSSWNQWLREEIPLLFLKALDKLKVDCYEPINCMPHLPHLGHMREGWGICPVKRVLCPINGQNYTCRVLPPSPPRSTMGGLSYACTYTWQTLTFTCPILKHSDDKCPTVPHRWGQASTTHPHVRPICAPGGVGGAYN